MRVKKWYKRTTASDSHSYWQRWNGRRCNPALIPNTAFSASVSQSECQLNDGWDLTTTWLPSYRVYHSYPYLLNLTFNRLRVFKRTLAQYVGVITSTLIHSSGFRYPLIAWHLILKVIERQNNRYSTLKVLSNLQSKMVVLHVCMDLNAENWLPKKLFSSYD